MSDLIAIAIIISPIILLLIKGYYVHARLVEGQVKAMREYYEGRARDATARENGWR